MATDRRTPSVAWLVLSGLGCVALFGMGLLPGYLFELDGQMNASERCPSRAVSESTYDMSCVERLIARGPLYLGKELLAGSFILGGIVIVLLYRLDRPLATGAAVARRGHRTLTVLMAVLYVADWVGLLAWNATEGQRLVTSGASVS